MFFKKSKKKKVKRDLGLDIVKTYVWGTMTEDQLEQKYKDYNFQWKDGKKLGEILNSQKERGWW